MFQTNMDTMMQTHMSGRYTFKMKLKSSGMPS